MRHPVLKRFIMPRRENQNLNCAIKTQRTRYGASVTTKHDNRITIHFCLQRMRTKETPINIQQQGKYDAYSRWYEGVSKSLRTESITKYTLTTINTRWEATKRVIAAKLIRPTHKIVIQLYLVAESCTICSSRSRQPVLGLLDTPSPYNMTARRFIYISAGVWCRQHAWQALLFFATCVVTDGCVQATSARNVPEHAAEFRVMECRRKFPHTLPCHKWGILSSRWRWGTIPLSPSLPE
jgi:hypothetical protein